MDDIELCLLITFWISVLISILYYYIDNCIRWIVVLKQVGGLHGVIKSLQLILEVFIKFGNLDVYGWVIFVDYFLNFNTCKHSIFMIMIIMLGWIVQLEQAGGLHGAIRQFTFILEVFTIFWKLGWIFFELYLLITFWTLILVSILYLWLRQLYWENCCVRASGWLAWCYKTVYIHIGSVYYFLKI